MTTHQPPAEEPDEATLPPKPPVDEMPPPEGDKPPADDDEPDITDDAFLPPDEAAGDETIDDAETEQTPLLTGDAPD